MPEMSPMLSGYSSEMYLNTEALPNAQHRPSTNSSTVNTQTLRPMCSANSPLVVWITMSVCGYDSRNRQIHDTHITHQVSRCAPTLSDIQPPTARITPPGSEKQAAISAAVLMEKPYSVMKYGGGRGGGAAGPPGT